jgi:hypothetical protein
VRLPIGTGLWGNVNRCNLSSPCEIGCTVFGCGGWC